MSRRKHAPEQVGLDASSLSVGGEPDDIPRSARAAARLVVSRALCPSSEGGPRGILSGIRSLDEKTGGWQTGDLILVAGRPGSGKTAFMLHCAMHAAALGVAVAVISYEMSGEALVMRALSSLSRLPCTAIRSGCLTEREREDLERAAEADLFDRLFIEDRLAPDIREVYRAALAMRRSLEIGLLVIDYIQLLGSGQERFVNSRAHEVAALSRALKALARSLAIPVIAASQLNRSIDTRSVRRPLMGDLRDSGGLEADADVIIALHRECLYSDLASAYDLDCFIIKHRNGPVGQIPLHFIAETMTFLDKEGR